MINELLALAITTLTLTTSLSSSLPGMPSIGVLGATNTSLAQRSFSLANRYPNPWVSDIFRDNILLTLSYMKGASQHGQPVDWSAVGNAQTYSFTLNPGEVFAFHDDVLPEYKGNVSKTANGHFNSADGYKSDGFLVGDGVCHLASFMYMVALDAGLTAVAPTNHDFAAIPEVPKEYGVAIYLNPSNPGSNMRQNLYITNNKDVPVTFIFTYDGTNLSVSVTQ